MKEVPTFTFGAQNLPNKEYHQWLIEIKQRFQQSQIKTAIKVNTALLEFYWSLGSDIVKKHKTMVFVLLSRTYKKLPTW